MKSQAYNEGYRAAIHFPGDACNPYGADKGKSTEWVRGYDDGMRSQSRPRAPAGKSCAGADGEFTG